MLLTLWITAAVLASPLQPEADLIATNATVNDTKVSFSTVANETESLAEAEVTPVSIEEKHLAEAASAAADRVVEALEKVRDEAWRNARGSLAIASDPPIRSAAVFDMLSAETDRFAQLEGQINAAKAKSAHKRRIADLAGGAWDAHEGMKLKTLREQEAQTRLAEAKAAKAKAVASEIEYIHELMLEKGRSL